MRPTQAPCSVPAGQGQCYRRGKARRMGRGMGRGMHAWVGAGTGSDGPYQKCVWTAKCEVRAEGRALERGQGIIERLRTEALAQDYAHEPPVASLSPGPPTSLRSPSTTARRRSSTLPTKPTLWAACAALAALIWWVEYLALRPPVLHSLNFRRPHVRTWTDASGLSRILAVFLFMEDAGIWEWTSVRLPDSIWDQLEARGDHQIGFQEVAAPMLALATWPSTLVRCSGLKPN